MPVVYIGDDAVAFPIVDRTCSMMMMRAEIFESFLMRRVHEATTMKDSSKHPPSPPFGMETTNSDGSNNSSNEVPALPLPLPCSRDRSPPPSLFFSAATEQGIGGPFLGAASPTNANQHRLLRLGGERQQRREWTVSPSRPAACDKLSEIAVVPASLTAAASPLSFDVDGDSDLSSSIGGVQQR
nr:hypothetical protein Iba_chr14fCG6850 [Ipomoea batatas]